MKLIMKSKQRDEIIEYQKITPRELSPTNIGDIKFSFPQKIDGGSFSKS